MRARRRARPGAGALLLLVPGLLAVDWGLDGGLSPLDLGADPPTSASCGECHPDEHAAWAASRHRAAWDNDLLLVGYAAEPLDFCVHCHAPLPEQKAEIRANRAWYRSLDPRSGIVPGSVDRLPEPRASEGIGCVVCHWRDGAVVARTRSWAAPHEVVEDPALGSGELCVTCHDFAVPETVDGALRLTEVPMQATGAEWRAWREAGGQQTCEGCHMAGGDHHVWGAHDRERLRDAVEVDVERVGGDVRFVLATAGVGHHLPSGDLFRHLTLEVDVGDGWRVAAWIGRRFEVTWDAETGLPSKRLVGDTALRPGEARTLDVPGLAPGAAWRLVWHDGAEHDEVRGLLDPAEITEVLRAGAVR